MSWQDVVPKPLSYKDALTDLHNGKGTKWVKDPNGRGYWPDCCDRHRPKEIIEARAKAAEARA